MRNTIIWDTLLLEEHGSALDAEAVRAFHLKESKKCQKLLNSAEAQYGIKLAGPGSDAPLRQLMFDCIQEAGLLTDQRVEWSAKTGKISIGVENVNLVLPLLPAGKNRKILARFQLFKVHSKLVTTYTRPLTSDKRKGIVTEKNGIGVVYSTWFPVPLYADTSDGGSQRDYSTSNAPRTGFRRPERPVGLVWRSPLDPDIAWSRPGASDRRG